MINSYIRFPQFKTKALTFSYDDGVRQDKRLIAIMQKYGLKGTFNINGGLFENKYEGVETGRMTQQEALELYISSNMEVAIHGYQHLSLSKVSSELAISDSITDRMLLEKLFKRVIKGMAYANGAYNDEVVDLLKKMGVHYARTTISTEKFDLPTDWMRLPTTCHHNNPKLMQLAKEFVEEEEHWYYWAKQLKLFYLWGHSYEFDNNNNWDVMEKFAEYMGKREDIWYATNGEIFDYLKATERLQFSADGSFVTNPSALDIYIDYIGKQCIIPVGKTVKIENGEVL